MPIIVAISLVTYNGEKWIKQCLEAVKNQSYKNWQVFVVDNNSQDGSVGLIKKIMPEADLIINQKNLGFSVGHNQNIRRLSNEAQYVLCLNQDAILDVDFLAHAVAALEKDSRAGALQGRILRIKEFFSVIPAKAGIHTIIGRPSVDSRTPLGIFDIRGNDKANKSENIIDTTGLFIFKNRQVINRGQGEIDRGQYDKSEEIFGADGAAPVYRVSVLKVVATPLLVSPLKKGGESDEYFDEDFFAYKEDVDLSWRLRLAGWQIIYEPRAIAWHGRSVSGDAIGLKNIRKQRQQISRFSRLYSCQNNYYMLLKNELSSLFWRHLPYIFWRQLKISVYILLFEPWMLKSIHRFFRTAFLMLKKRKIIMTKKTVDAKEMKKWFV